MKKVAFAIQVFGLIAMFPAYMIAELNHGTGRLSIDNSCSGIIMEAPKKSIPSSLNADDKNGEMVLFIFNMNLY